MSNRRQCTADDEKFRCSLITSDDVNREEQSSRSIFFEGLVCIWSIKNDRICKSNRSSSLKIWRVIADFQVSIEANINFSSKLFPMIDYFFFFCHENWIYRLMCIIGRNNFSLISRKSHAKILYCVKQICWWFDRNSISFDIGSFAWSRSVLFHSPMRDEFGYSIGNFVWILQRFERTEFFFMQIDTYIHWWNVWPKLEYMCDHCINNHRKFSRRMTTFLDQWKLRLLF